MQQWRRGNSTTRKNI